MAAQESPFSWNCFRLATPNIPFASSHLFFSIAQVPINKIVIIAGLGFAIVIPMLITSFNKPMKWMGAPKWKILHRTGMYNLMLVFIISFWPGISGNPSLSKAYLINYAAFELTLLIAVVLRIVVFVRQKFVVLEA